MLIRWLYTVFLAVLLVTFVGVGIAAFYKAPKQPEYPLELQTPSAPPTATSSSDKNVVLSRNFAKNQQDYVKASNNYNKNVSTISITCSLLILILSISLLSKIFYISDGLLLGGVLTLIYGIFRGFGSGDEMFRFIVVSIGLVVAIFLGYWKFVKGLKPQPKKR